MSVKMKVIATGLLVDLQYNNTDKRINKGDEVEYLGHMVGGCVKIKYADKEYIAHPGCFEELR